MYDDAGAVGRTAVHDADAVSDIAVPSMVARMLNTRGVSFFNDFLKYKKYTYCST